MQIEQQLANQELSKKLEKLGVKQDSHWYWKLSETKFILVDKFYLFDKNLHGDSRVYSAFTVAEIFNIIGKLPIEIYLNGGKWNVSSYGLPDYYEENLADALAKMLIYLLEQGLKTICSWCGHDCSDGCYTRVDNKPKCDACTETL